MGFYRCNVCTVDNQRPMNKTQEALKLALEALELAQDNLRDHGDNCFLHDEGEYNRCFCGKDALSNHLQSVVEKLDEALAEQPVQEPVAWDNCRGEKQCRIWCGNSACGSHWNDTSPPTQRKPLTDEQINAFFQGMEPNNGFWLSFARAIKAAHGIKGDA